MGAGPRSPSCSPQTLKRKGLGLESHELELDEGSDPGEKARRLSEGMDLSVGRPRFYVSRCRPVTLGGEGPQGSPSPSLTPTLPCRALRRCPKQPTAAPRRPPTRPWAAPAALRRARVALPPSSRQHRSHRDARRDRCPQVGSDPSHGEPAAGEKVPAVGTLSPPWAPCPLRGHLVLAGPVGIFPAGCRMQSSCRSISQGLTGSGAGVGAWAGSAATAVETPSPASIQLFPVPCRHPAPGWSRHPTPTAPSRASQLGVRHEGLILPGGTAPAQGGDRDTGASRATRRKSGRKK